MATLIQQTIDLLMIPRVIPITGCVFGLLLFGYNFYSLMLRSGPKSSNVVYLLINALFTFTGYAFWISANRLIPLAGAMFVAGTFVDVFKEMIIAWDESRKRCLRSAFLHRHAAMINLYASIGVLIVMSFWCFLTPSITLTLSAASSIGVIYLLRGLSSGTSTVTDK